jgi:hypothetical protein
LSNKDAELLKGNEDKTPPLESVKSQDLAGAGGAAVSDNRTRGHARG